MKDDPTEWIIDNTRVEDSAGYVGTVRYVGFIRNTNYIGVEWDEPSRGKHNGSLVEDGNLTNYFTTQHPTAGSFVKPSKLRTGRLLNIGIVYEKYVPMDSDERNDDLGNVGNKRVELVGELHIRRYQQIACLSCLSLRRCSLNGVDETFGLSHIVELDLAGNLFSTWDRSVFPILRQFPQLQRLSLAYNRINDISEDDEMIQEHASLIHLNLQKTNVISSIHKVQTLCPNLQELILAGNPLKTLHLQRQETLRSLDVSACSLVSVGELPPQLTLLNLDDNPEFDSSFLTTIPPSLKTLQIASIGISLLQLRNLLMNTQVQRLRSDHDRMLTIANCPHVVLLNGCMVRSDERTSAGVFALRSPDIDDSLKEYWRGKLPANYGAATASVNELQQTRLVQVTFQCSIPEASTTESLVRNLPRTVSMAALSKMVARHYSLDEGSFELYVLSNEGFPELLTTLETVSEDAVLMINSVATDETVSLQDKIIQQEEERNQFLEQQKRLR